MGMGLVGGMVDSGAPELALCVSFRSRTFRYYRISFRNVSVPVIFPTPPLTRTAAAVLLPLPATAVAHPTTCRTGKKSSTISGEARRL